MDKIFLWRVLDALTQSEHNPGTGFHDGCKVLVGARETVAFGKGRVGIEIRKSSMNVDHVRIGPMAIVQARQRDGQLAMIGREIHRSAIVQRSAVDAVKRTRSEERRVGKECR